MSNTRQFMPEPSLSRLHQHRHRDHQPRLIGQSDVPLPDPEGLPHALAAFGEHHLRFPPGVLHHAHIADPDTVREAGAHGLDDRFLGGKPHRQETRRPLRLGELHVLRGHEQMLHEARSESLQGLIDALRLEHIDTDSENHPRAATMRAFISRTATANPSNTAREMMAWPMLSSTISLIAATGCTL